MYTQEQLNAMNKAQLVEIIEQLQSAPVSKNGRKEQVLAALLDGPKNIQEIADFVGGGIDTRNVSSQLVYIKKEHPIMTLPGGQKVIPGMTKGYEEFKLPA